MAESNAFLVDTIMQNVGGKENVDNFSNCSNSLRFSLKDSSKANPQALKGLDDIITVVQKDELFQVVIGSEAPELGASIKDLGVGEQEVKKPSLWDSLISTLSGVLAPVLTILAATGMIKGLLSLFVFLNWMTEDSGTYLILYAVSDGFFYFMPIFLGATAAKRFGCNQFLGMAIGAALVYPTITNLSNQEAIATLFGGTIFESQVYTTFLGIPVILPAGSGYTSTVVPIILSVYAASLISKFWDKVIPELVRGFLSPTFTLMIAVPLTFIVVGPIASILASIIATAAQFLYNLSPLLEGVFLGFFWQILVIFGLHWAIVPIALLNLSQFKFDAFMQPAYAASFAQLATCAAILLKTKDQPLKELAIPAVVSACFGITEPAIYGVTLPRPKFFIISCIGAAVGGGIIGYKQVKVYIFAMMSIFGLPGYINPENGDASGVIWILVGVFAAMAVSFILTYFMYSDTPIANKAEFGDRKNI